MYEPSTPTSESPEELRRRLADAEEMIRAISGGEVDALLLDGPEGKQVYTLRGAERPYRLLIEEMQEGAATVSGDGAIMYCNRRLAEMLGVSLERVIGTSLLSHVSATDAGRVDRTLRAGCERPGRAECGMVHATRGVVPVRLTVSPLPGDMPVCVCVIATDMTEELRTQELLEAREALRRSEDRLKRALKELEGHRDDLEATVAARTNALRDSHERLRHSERMAALGTLAAGLGHDVSNTLLPLRVRLDLIEQARELSGESRAHVDAIRGFVDYLASLSRGLRQFARDPEQAAGEQRTDLEQWRQDVGRFLVASVDQSVDVRIDLEPGLPAAAIAPHRLTQVVLNLIHNGSDAIKVARGRFAEGRIDINARAENGGVAIGVRDDGCGMAEDVRERCFEPFFTTKARGQGGTGLGLSMVFGIIANAGGHLSTESAQGRGTEIKVWLPAADVRREGQRPRRLAHVTLTDARMRGVVAAMLQTLGHRVAAGPPDPEAVLWITDPDSAAPEQASAFLRADPRRRVVVLGGDDAWANCGAAVQSTRAPVESLRRTLELASGG